MHTMETPARTLTRVGLAALFCTAGALHFAYPEPFERVMPAYLPLHHELVLASGLLEILGGVGLLAPHATVRRVAGWGLVVLLVAVFPANVNMALNNPGFTGLLGNPLVLWLRLLFQPILIWAVWWCTSPPRRVPSITTR